MPKLMTSLKIPSTFYLWKGGKCPLCLVGWLYPVCTGLSQNLLAVGVGGWSNRTPWLECVRRSKMKIQGEKGHVQSRTRPKIFQGRPDLRSTQKDPPGPGARIQSKAKSTKKTLAVAPTSKLLVAVQTPKNIVIRVKVSYGCLGREEISIIRCDQCLAYDIGKSNLPRK